MKQASRTEAFALLISSLLETKPVTIHQVGHAQARGCMLRGVCPPSRSPGGEKLWKGLPSEMFLLRVSGEPVCCEAARWPGKHFHPGMGLLTCWGLS